MKYLNGYFRLIAFNNQCNPELSDAIKTWDLMINTNLNCLNECWLSVQSDVSSLHLPNYDMYYQVGNCPGHTHCGLITYVHNSFKSNEININYDATGWKHLTIEISYNSPNAKKYLVLNIYKPPEKYVAELDEFITEFSSFLTLLQHRIRTSFICGDFN